MYYKYFSWFEFFLGLVIAPAKMLWGLVMFDWERAFCFSTLAKTYTQWPTVRCQKGISAWPYVIVLPHHVTLVSRCDIFMVWDIPSGLYSFLKQQCCCLCVCYELQPSGRREDFKGRCVDCLLGMEHMCTHSYFLWNASSEFILFPFLFPELNRSYTAPFYFSHHIANAGGETTTAVILPWLNVEIYACIPPIFR